MAKLYHHPLDPHSRFVRLILAEYGTEPDLVEERAFERRQEFLVLNPAGTVPVHGRGGGRGGRQARGRSPNISTRRAGRRQPRGG